MPVEEQIYDLEVFGRLRFSDLGVDDQQVADRKGIFGCRYRLPTLAHERVNEGEVNPTMFILWIIGRACRLPARQEFSSDHVGIRD